MKKENNGNPEIWLEDLDVYSGEFPVLVPEIGNILNVTMMNKPEMTREDMWAKQALEPAGLDYSVWERDRAVLSRRAVVSRSCTFVVDVYRCRYAFASSGFADILGYDRRMLEKIERNGDYLESRIHPDDLSRIKSLQVDLARFIYNQPVENRNHYKNNFSYRVLNAASRYVNVTSNHQVMRTSAGGKAWLILGVVEIAPDQRPLSGVGCTVLNMKTGDLFSPDCFSGGESGLTEREIEVLQWIKRGLAGKEIARQLGISPHTVNIHRQNVLRKLGARNSVEAVILGGEKGLIV